MAIAARWCQREVFRIISPKKPDQRILNCTLIIIRKLIRMVSQQHAVNLR
jgi:hypothetical protein